MAGPGNGTEVVTDALRDDVRMWDQQAEVLLKIRHTMATLHLTRGEAGIYQAMVGDYEKVVNFVADRTKEGHDRMTEIADALVKNAKAYDRNEADVTEHVEGTY